MFKSLFRKLLPNPLDSLLKKSKHKKKFLICWNRGIGDIALGLYAICERIRYFIKDAKITFLTRKDLESGFLLLDNVDVITTNWERGKKYKLEGPLSKFDVIIKNPDPSYWVKWQIGNLVPKLTWKKEFDDLHKKYTFFNKNFSYIGVQVSSDFHSLNRDWPKCKWEELFKRSLIRDEKMKFIIFGKEKFLKFLNLPNVIDLRGKTSFLDVISIIKNRCGSVILPDGGILSILYFLNISFKIKVISLWQDIQGVLKQKVKSPNKQMEHLPILSKKDISKIRVSMVEGYLFS